MAEVEGIKPPTRGFGSRRSITELHPYRLLLKSMLSKPTCHTKIKLLNWLRSAATIKKTQNTTMGAIALGVKIAANF